MGHGGDVRPQKGGLGDVPGVADGGGDDLDGKVLDLDHLHDLPKKLPPVPGDVVHPPQEGAHVAGPGPGGEEAPEATGFVEHLKLPHYVDFQSELGLLRKLRAEFGEAEAQPAMQEAAE